MKKLVVSSGTGGAGKTSIAASLVALAQQDGCRVVAADCDVRAASLGRLLRGQDAEPEPFFVGRRAWIDADLCDGCATCLEFCPEGVIYLERGLAHLEPGGCVGCGVCAHLCPTGAIFMETVRVGTVLHRTTDRGPLIHARLEPGQDNSDRLVAEVRRRASAATDAVDAELVLVDGPSGIGRSVHAAMTGCDLLLAVTEPTVAGQADLLRLLELARQLGLPVAVLLNKVGLGGADGVDVAARAEQAGARLVARLPYDPAVAQALLAGELPLVVPSSAGPLRAAWPGLRELLEAERPPAQSLSTLSRPASLAR